MSRNNSYSLKLLKNFTLIDKKAFDGYCTISNVPLSDSASLGLMSSPSDKKSLLFSCRITSTLEPHQVFNEIACKLVFIIFSFVAHSRNQRDNFLVLTAIALFLQRDNFSIVYEYEGDSFKRHYLNKDPVESIFFSKAHKFRLFCYYREPGVIYEKINVQKFWKLLKYLQPNKWLEIWLRRELQALTQDEDVDILVHHVLGLIESFRKQKDRGLSQRTTEENRDAFKALIYGAVKPFLIGRTERFVNEIELFLSSGLNIEAYDEVYSQSLEMTLSGTVGEEGERLQKENTQVPYLYFFDEGSDTE